MIGSRRNIVARGGNKYALEFDGGGQQVEVGDQLKFSSSEISISAWTYLESDAPSNAGIIGGGIGVRLHWERRNGNWRLRLGDSSWTDLPIQNFGQWVHLAFTYNRNTEELKYYHDGNEVAIRSGDSGSDNYFDRDGDPNVIGSSIESLVERPWKGKIDDVQIYDRALNPTEVLLLSKGVKISPVGLVGHWKFNEGSGLIAYDSSGNGNNGTLVGNPTWTTDTPL